MSRRVLVVDDEPLVQQMLVEILEQRGLDVVCAPDAGAALEAYRRRRFEVVITDVHLGSRSGIEMIREIHEIDDEATVVVLTGDPASNTASKALERGAYDYLVKAFATPDVIGAAVERAVERDDLRQRNRHLLDQVQHNSNLLENLNEKLTDIANRDPLTGLYNRRFFLEALALELNRSRRHERTCALILAGIDDFRHYNDFHGHLLGDEVLRILAQLLQAHSRSSTVVARFGSGLFALLVPEIPPEGARIFAETLGRAVAKHLFPGGEAQPEGRVTLSLGVAVCPEAGTEAPQLTQAAATALETAAKSGYNRVSVWGCSGDR
jgi:diguanylate cyclase (GGDEF)-like protein